MMNLRNILRKYLIIGSQNCQQDPVKVLSEAAKAGITAFQYREKRPGSLTGQAKLELGLKLREICAKHHVLFIVNDDLDLVEPLDADGIHVGQDDLPVKVIRKQFPDKIIGLSISNATELAQSPISLVDYIGAGPVFNTTTKADAKTPVGLNWIKELRSQYPHLPIVGIGGINTDNASSVMDAGADGVAFISAVTEADNIQAAIAKL